MRGRRRRAPADGRGDARLALRLEPVDVVALEPAAQALCADGVGRLLHAVGTPLHLLVRRRRVAPPPAPGSERPTTVAEALDAAVRHHVAAELAARAAFRSDVWVLLDAPALDGSYAERQAALVAEALRAAGLRVQAGTPPHATTPTAERAGWSNVGGSACVALELDRLPGAPVALGWMQPLLSASEEFDLSIVLAPLPPSAADRLVERRLRDLNADRLLEADRGRIQSARLEAGLESATALRDALARHEIRPFRLALTVAVFGPDALDAHRAAEVVRAAGAAAGMRLRRAHFRHAPAVAGSGGVPSGGTGKLVSSAAAVTCLPLTETVCADPGGYRIGVARTGGAPVSVDVFDTALHGNANVAVFAASGHGKSFTLGMLVLEAMAHGVGALIVDPEGEYERLMTAAGGQHLRLGEPGAGALNVFDAAPTHAEAIPIAVDLVNVLCGSVLSEVERARVDAAAHATVAAAHEAGRVPLLGDCAGRLEAVPRAAAVLRRVCTGPLGAIFNRPSDVDLRCDLCAISLRDLGHEFVPAATLLLASWLWTRVRRERVRRHVVLDEVGALCAHAPLRDLLVQLARRCRKYAASLVVATQNVEDLLRTDEGSVVATNCATVLLGGHRAAEARRMEHAFGLTDAQRRFVEHAGRGEFLLLAGRRRCEIRVDAPPLHRSILVPAEAR